MEPKILGHLTDVEAVMKGLHRLLSDNTYPNSLRTVIVLGSIDQMIEHHKSMLLLIRNDRVGSAFTLARSVFESLYRGLWFNLCATDAEMEEFERSDSFPNSMRQTAEAIDDAYNADGFFEDLRVRAWSALCSYTHTGLLQLGRRYTDTTLIPAYSETEIIEVTTSVTTFVLLLAGKFLAVQGFIEQSRYIEGLVSTYGVPVQDV